MLSGKLLRLIETHSEQITDSVLRLLRADTEITHLNSLADAELFETWNHRLSHLERWLVPAQRGALALDEENVAKLRFADGIPLHEMVYAFHLLRNQTISYVRNLAPDENYLELYAEGELERWLANFFDFLVFHTVRGYEQAFKERTAGAQVR
jgi:hypothetical protein